MMKSASNVLWLLMLVSHVAAWPNTPSLGKLRGTRKESNQNRFQKKTRRFARRLGAKRLLFFIPDTTAPSVSNQPSKAPSIMPTSEPTVSANPSFIESETPTSHPTASPTLAPTPSPSAAPSNAPSDHPSNSPTPTPSAAPTNAPSDSPSNSPTSAPTTSPTGSPSVHPTVIPSSAPTATPTTSPSESPTQHPTIQLSTTPSAMPSTDPTQQPSNHPSTVPSMVPSASPSVLPSSSPSIEIMKTKTATIVLTLQGFEEKLNEDAERKFETQTFDFLRDYAPPGEMHDVEMLAVTVLGQELTADSAENSDISGRRLLRNQRSLETTKTTNLELFVRVVGDVVRGVAPKHFSFEDYLTKTFENNWAAYTQRLSQIDTTFEHLNEDDNPKASVQQGDSSETLKVALALVCSFFALLVAALASYYAIKKRLRRKTKEIGWEPFNQATRSESSSEEGSGDGLIPFDDVHETIDTPPEPLQLQIENGDASSKDDPIHGMSVCGSEAKRKSVSPSVLSMGSNEQYGIHDANNAHGGHMGGNINSNVNNNVNSNVHASNNTNESNKIKMNKKWMTPRFGRGSVDGFDTESNNDPPQHMDSMNFAALNKAGRHSLDPDADFAPPYFPRQDGHGIGSQDSEDSGNNDGVQLLSNKNKRRTSSDRYGENKDGDDDEEDDDAQYFNNKSSGNGNKRRSPANRAAAAATTSTTTQSESVSFVPKAFANTPLGSVVNSTANSFFGMFSNANNAEGVGANESTKPTNTSRRDDNGSSGGNTNSKQTHRNGSSNGRKQYVHMSEAALSQHSAMHGATKVNAIGSETTSSYWQAKQKQQQQQQQQKVNVKQGTKSEASSGSSLYPRTHPHRPSMNKHEQQAPSVDEKNRGTKQYGSSATATATQQQQQRQPQSPAKWNQRPLFDTATEVGWDDDDNRNDVEEFGSRRSDFSLEIAKEPRLGNWEETAMGGLSVVQSKPAKTMDAASRTQTMPTMEPDTPMSSMFEKSSYFSTNANPPSSVTGGRRPSSFHNFNNQEQPSIAYQHPTRQRKRDQPQRQRQRETPAYASTRISYISSSSASEDDSEYDGGRSGYAQYAFQTGNNTGSHNYNGHDYNNRNTHNYNSDTYGTRSNTHTHSNSNGGASNSTSHNNRYSRNSDSQPDRHGAANPSPRLSEEARSTFSLGARPMNDHEKKYYKHDKLNVAGGDAQSKNRESRGGSDHSSNASGSRYRQYQQQLRQQEQQQEQAGEDIVPASLSHQENLYDIFAPSGPIGIVVDTTKYGPAVHSIKSTSPVLGLINRGDLIVSLDDEDTRSMTAAALTRMLAKKSRQRERKITLIAVNRF